MSLVTFDRCFCSLRGLYLTRNLTYRLQLVDRHKTAASHFSRTSMRLNIKFLRLSKLWRNCFFLSTSNHIGDPFSDHAWSTHMKLCRIAQTVVSTGWPFHNESSTLIQKVESLFVNSEVIPKIYKFSTGNVSTWDCLFDLYSTTCNFKRTQVHNEDLNG